VVLDGTRRHTAADLHADAVVARISGDLGHELGRRVIIDHRIAHAGHHEITDQADHDRAAEEDLPLLFQCSPQGWSGPTNPTINILPTTPAAKDRSTDQKAPERSN